MATKPDAAVEELRRAVQLDPSNSAAYTLAEPCSALAIAPMRMRRFRNLANWRPLPMPTPKPFSTQTGELSC